MAWKPPFDLVTYGRTDVGPEGGRKEPLPPDPRDFIPYPHAEGSDASPQAVRVIRDGQSPVTVRLATNRKFKIGRWRDCELWFPDSSVSRLHGLLYFVPENSCWAFKDPFTRRRTTLYSADNPGETTLMDAERPYQVTAGQVVELGSPRNRLEFLGNIPEDAAGLGSEGRWASRAGRKLEGAIRKAARKQGPVLLVGPSGSGKTFLAQEIHHLSKRTGPYISVNASRLPRNAEQFVSEMCGHLRGAYTGSAYRRKGVLFQADKGTVFLDEINSLPEEGQAFLLDLLEGKAAVRPLGADEGFPPPDVRIITASNMPLDETPLRTDLVNRLVRGHKIVVPSLADRRDDIPILAAAIIEEMRAVSEIDAALADDAKEFLLEQDWPGHVRQLADVLNNAADGHQGELVVLHADDLAEELKAEQMVRGSRTEPKEAKLTPFSGAEEETRPVGPRAIPARKRPADLTADDITNVLRFTKGNKKMAATLLGLSPTTLRLKRKQFGL